jgi:hypothetical protein
LLELRENDLSRMKKAGVSNGTPAFPFLQFIEATAWSLERRSVPAGMPFQPVVR